MGEVIQLFRALGTEAEEFVFDEHVTEELMSSIAEVNYDLSIIESAPTAADFTATMRSIKERVAAWPDS